MHIYLNPPRTFWAIPETDIILSRSKPFYELLEEELNELSEEQATILKTAKETGVIMEVNPDFIPKGTHEVGPEFILSRPANEIQRRYVSKMLMAKDLKGLEALLRSEEKGKNRPQIIALLKIGLSQLLNAEEFFYQQIEEVEEDIAEVIAEKERNGLPAPRRSRAAKLKKEA